MARKDRFYRIKFELTGNPPKLGPILTTRNNQVIPPDQRIVFNKNTDHMRKVDHYRIRFDISNFGDSQLRFVPNKADVMWVHKEPDCPDTPCSMPAVFWTDEIDEDGEWIDVINMDLKEENFQFTLNFVDKSIVDPTLSDYVPLDPGGGNENNGSAGSGTRFDYFTAVAAGFAAGLVAFFGARLLLNG